MKTILREQAELQSPKGEDSLSLDEPPPPPTGGASSSSGGRKLKKVNSLMAACHQGLEHNVSKILWRKVRTSDNIVCTLGVSPSLVSRWHEGYSFWSS